LRLLCYVQLKSKWESQKLKYTSNERGVISVLFIILVVIVVIAVGVALFESHHVNRQAGSSPSPSSSSVVRATSSPSPSPTAAPSSYFDIVDLGVKFLLPASFSDLEYKVVHLTGDEAVNSVAFSSKRLDAAGCGLDTAPLGYLTYDSDKGGSMVAIARNSNLYYLQPQAGCKASATLQDWQSLETALKSLVSDK